MWASLSLLTILVANAYCVCVGCNYNYMRDRFEEFMIVDQFIKYPPIDPLSSRFGSYCANFGNSIPRCAVLQEPLTSFPNPDNSVLHTIIGVALPTLEEIDNNGTECLFQLVNNVPGANIKDGDAVVPYRPPIAPPGCGYRRVTRLVYIQPEYMNVTTNECCSYSDISDISDVSAIPENECIKFNLTAYVEGFQLGNPLAGNFFNLESACGAECGDSCNDNNNGCNNGCNNGGNNGCNNGCNCL